MAPRTPTPLIKVDVSKRAEEQTPVPHNRWHPDIPAASTWCYQRKELVDDWWHHTSKMRSYLRF